MIFSVATLVSYVSLFMTPGAPAPDRYGHTGGRRDGREAAADLSQARRYGASGNRQAWRAAAAGDWLAAAGLSEPDSGSGNSQKRSTGTQPPLRTAPGYWTEYVVTGAPGEPSSLRLGRLSLRSPRLVAAGVEMQREGLPIELGLELVLNVGGADKHAAEIARRAAALAPPDPLEHDSAQSSD